MTEGFIWRELSFSSTTDCCVGQLDCVAIRATKALAGTTCPHQPQLGLPSTLCPLMQELHWRLGLGINSVIAVWAPGWIPDIAKLLFPSPRLTSDLTCHLSFATSFPSPPCPACPAQKPCWWRHCLRCGHPQLLACLPFWSRSAPAARWQLPQVFQSLELSTIEPVTRLCQGLSQTAYPLAPRLHTGSCPWGSPCFPCLTCKACRKLWLACRGREQPIRLLSHPLHQK